MGMDFITNGQRAWRRAGEEGERKDGGGDSEEHGGGRLENERTVKRVIGGEG